jgi:putative ABC transport system substrate-binding protein
MASVGDPVGSGFVASLARPGGDITGVSAITSDLSAKLLGFVPSNNSKHAGDRSGDQLI